MDFSVKDLAVTSGMYWNQYAVSGSWTEKDRMQTGGYEYSWAFMIMCLEG